MKEKGRKKIHMLTHFIFVKSFVTILFLLQKIAQFFSYIQWLLHFYCY